MGSAAESTNTEALVRYAILFAGLPDRRHLNGLEFCYRTLVDRYRFDPENVISLIRDGSLDARDDLSPVIASPRWPGDGTPYRMRVTGEGSRQGFRHALDTLKRKLDNNDLLFINTTGHGGNYGDGRGPYLIAFPGGSHYTTSEFCEDLADLPQHHSLVVLMSQCFSGGFNTAVIRASTAERAFIAASADDRHRSFAMSGDNDWDSFQRSWIGAIAGRDVDGSALPREPATDDVGRVTVRAAFDYASDHRIKEPRDTPQCTSNSEVAERITLDAA
jgi:hypothetical protein